MADSSDARPAYQQMADQLRQRIVSGGWPAGHRVPSETALINEFGVSRVTVRQAVRELRNQGLVLTRQGVGSFVRGDVPPRHRMVVDGVCRVAEIVDWPDAPAVAGQPPTWVWESVQARMPTPEEQTGLKLPAGVPVLVLSRRAPGQPGTDENDRPAVTAVLPADRIVLDYLLPAPGDPTEPVTAAATALGIPVVPDTPTGGAR